LTTTRPPAKRNHWIFSGESAPISLGYAVCEGQEMWRGAGSRPDAIRGLKQVRKGDRVLCYHACAPSGPSTPLQRSRETHVSDPHDRESKMMVADLRAMERLTRQLPLDNSGQPCRAKSEVPEKRTVNHLPDHRRRVPGDSAHGGIVATPGLRYREGSDW